MRLCLVAAFLLCVAVSELDRASSNAHSDVATKAGLESSHAREKQRQEAHVRLLQIIERFSSVMSLEIDGELYQEIRNEFAAVLEEYDALGITCAGRVELIHAAILGSFRLQGNVVKDTLAKGDLKHVSRASVTDYAYWGLDLLKSILSAPIYGGSECSTRDVLNTPHGGRTALRLAAELRMLKVVQVLVESGGSVFHCGSGRCGDDLERVACGCVKVLLPAVWNGDKEMAALLVEGIRETHRTSSYANHLQEENWLCDVFNKVCGNSSTAVSLLQAAYLHCMLLSVWAVYDYLISTAGPRCSVNLDSNILHLALQHKETLCPGFQLPTLDLPGTSTNSNSSPHKKSHVASSSKTTRQLGWGPRWTQRISKRTEASGWAVYSDFNVGRVGCDLPRVRVEDLEEDTFKLYEQLRYVRTWHCLLWVNRWSDLNIILLYAYMTYSCKYPAPYSCIISPCTYTGIYSLLGVLYYGVHYIFQVRSFSAVVSQW